MSNTSLYSYLQTQDQSPFPVTGVRMKYQQHEIVPMHQHQRCHLIYATQGILLVESSSEKWMVPPTTAVWLRPEVKHRLIMQTDVDLYGILVDYRYASSLKTKDGVIHVSPLLRELIIRLVSLGQDMTKSVHRELMSQFFLEELKQQHQLPYFLPWPFDKKLIEVCEQLSKNPAHEWTKTEWAEWCSMSVKTFHRHFFKNTGMTFGQWHQKLRLLSTLNLLLSGFSIKEAALSSGYASHSAYTTSFKKYFGKSPSAFTTL